MTDRELMQQALRWADQQGEAVFAGGGMDAVDSMNEWAQALRSRLAQPEQEPVGDEWTPCIKLPVVVHVRKQRLGEAHISTREGITPVKPDDLIMRGVSGEEYPIGRAIFEQTYSLDTTPPQRKPLSDDELSDIWFKQSTDWMEFARAIEAAHGITGEKNG